MECVPPAAGSGTDLLEGDRLVVALPQVDLAAHQQHWHTFAEVVDLWVPLREGDGEWDRQRDVQDRKRERQTDSGMGQAGDRKKDRHWDRQRGGQQPWLRVPFVGLEQLRGCVTFVRMLS